VSEVDLVSVIVPTLEEEADIEGCIGTLAAQDYPIAALEVIVVDGCSRDQTHPRAERALREARFGRGVVLTSLEARTSRALNVGLESARGMYVVRIDARSRVAPGYIRNCVETLSRKPEVGVTGGAQVALPRGPGASDVGIARALRNRWTTGLSRYRRSTQSGAADTVWMGAFRRADLVSLGGWNPDVALNEDFELCQRYRDDGATVWFDDSLQSGYIPRPNLGALGRQYFRFGRVKGTWWARGDRPRPRQLLLLAAPLFGAGVVLALRRRFGWRGAAVVIGASLIVVEAAGTREPRGGVGAHLASTAAIVTSAGAWWFGTIVGFAGDRMGVRHRHG
jgi:glycosyltransferase involved in cell wall biosynthesis